MPSPPTTKRNVAGSFVSGFSLQSFRAGPKTGMIACVNCSRYRWPSSLLRLRPDLSPKSPPTAADVLLVVEVSDSSVAYDRSVKRRLYAEAGIPEYWIVNLQDQVIEVYSNPVKGEYKRAKQAKRGATLPLPGGLAAVIQVSDILGNT